MGERKCFWALGFSNGYLYNNHGSFCRSFSSGGSTFGACNLLGMAALHGAMDCYRIIFFGMVVLKNFENTKWFTYTSINKVSPTIVTSVRCLEHCRLFGLQSMLFYGTATWLPTILVSKGFTLNNAGFIVSITGLLGSLIGIAVPHYSSKLRDLRILLAIVGLVISISFAALIFDHGWHLIIWLLISNIGLSISFPLSLLLTVTRSVEAGETRSLSIMAQSVGYLMAAFAPGIVGAIYDTTQDWNIALLIPIALAIVMGGVGYFAGRPEKIFIDPA